MLFTFFFFLRKEKAREMTGRESRAKDGHALFWLVVHRSSVNEIKS